MYVLPIISSAQVISMTTIWLNSQLLFNSRVIPIKAKNEPISPSIRSANAQGLRRFSAFLPTLPSLASCLTAASDNDIPWPSFTNDSAEPSNRLSVENVKIKQRERETCLLNGVVEGLEVSQPPIWTSFAKQCDKLKLVFSYYRHLTTKHPPDHFSKACRLQKPRLCFPLSTTTDPAVDTL